MRTPPEDIGTKNHKILHIKPHLKNSDRLKRIVYLPQEQFEEYDRENHIGTMTSWLIRSASPTTHLVPLGWSGVLHVTWQLWLLGHGLFSHQDLILKHYGLPCPINKWPYWGIIPLWESAVGIFYRPSWQGEFFFCANALGKGINLSVLSPAMSK